MRRRADSAPSRSVAADQHGALAHPAHAAALAARRRGRPWPSSSTSSVGRAAGELEPDLGALGLGVAGDVRQRLLGDAVEDELLVAAEVRQARAARGTSTVELGVLGDALAEHAQGARQAEVVERLGPQPARDPAHLLEAPAGGLLRLHDALARALAARRGRRGRAAARRRSASARRRRGAPARRAAARPPGRRARGATLSRRSASSRSSISLNAAASSAASESPPPTSSRRPGSSGSIRRANVRQLAQRRERVAQQQQVEREHQHEAADEDRELAQRDVLDARARRRAR